MSNPPEDPNADPADQTPKPTSTKKGLSDMRGIAQLATQATMSVTRIAEGVHRSVQDGIGIPGAAEDGLTRGLTGMVYRSVHDGSKLVGQGIDAALSKLEPLFESAEDAQPGTPQREAILAALNGVMGDKLLATKNPFTTTMSLRYRQEALNWQDLPSMPEVTGKVLLLIHGACMNDLQWTRQHQEQTVNHGQSLASALGYTPVYLRYNSGLHISQNGHELAAQLEQLIQKWPTEIDELSVVAHSMGGLVTRSAMHSAHAKEFAWPSRLKNLICLGTPHHGAPLEKAGNWVDVLLGSTSYTAPFATLGKLRSSGITDLRYGNIVDADWHGHDRFHRKADSRQPVPLPADVNCYTVAATMAAKPGTLTDQLVGDGLVPLNSALGIHRNPERTLAFPESNQWIAYKMNHMELLGSPEVARQMIDWLGAE